MVFFAREYMWVPQHSKDTLRLSAVSLIIVCSLNEDNHLILGK